MKGVRKQPTEYPEFCKKDGRLYRHFLHSLDFNDNTPEEEWKLCITREGREEILKDCHDDATAGHLGIAKTTSRLARLYYWPKIFANGRDYVRGCISCQRFKAQRQATAGTMRATDVQNPWETVAIDLVGRLPRSNDGNTWLLVMQASARAIVTTFNDLIVMRFGCPREVRRRKAVHQP